MFDNEDPTLNFLEDIGLIPFHLNSHLTFFRK